MTDISILDVHISDSDELLKIYEPYVLNTAITFDYEVPTSEQFKKKIENISKKYPCLKAVYSDGTILGYAYAGVFKDRKAYDWSVETTIYLRMDMKRQKVGTMLYESLETRLKEMGILNMNACIALAKVEDEHLTNASVHFHEALGFQKVGVFHDSGYKFNTWYDMIWMEKMIGDHLSNQPDVKFN